MPMGLDGRVDAARTWTVVMPVKVLASAKSRLAGDGPDRGELAFAFLQDALAAATSATAVGEVVVATADPRVSAAARAAGATVVDDTGHRGINAAAAWAAQQRARAGAVAIMVSDLPCLSAPVLDLAVHLADAQRTSFLADASGTGTTMWFATAGNPVAPRFGHGSGDAHRAAGDVDLAARHPDHAPALLRARLDVDMDADLTHAMRLGVGPHTRMLLEGRALLSR